MGKSVSGGFGTESSTVLGERDTRRRTTRGRIGGTSKTEESTQSTPSGRRKTSLSGTSLLGSMAKFAARTAARTGQSQELYSGTLLAQAEAVVAKSNTDYFILKTKHT